MSLWDREGLLSSIMLTTEPQNTQATPTQFVEVPLEGHHHGPSCWGTPSAIRSRIWLTMQSTSKGHTHTTPQLTCLHPLIPISGNIDTLAIQIPAGLQLPTHHGATIDWYGWAERDLWKRVWYHHLCRDQTQRAPGRLLSPTPGAPKISRGFLHQAQTCQAQGSTMTLTSFCIEEMEDTAWTKSFPKALNQNNKQM